MFAGKKYRHAEELILMPVHKDIFFCNVLCAFQILTLFVLLIYQSKRAVHILSVKWFQMALKLASDVKKLLCKIVMTLNTKSKLHLHYDFYLGWTFTCKIL